MSAPPTGTAAPAASATAAPNLDGGGNGSGGGRLAQAFADVMAVTHRNLLGYVRIPQALFFASVQPIMFVLLFRYAFGGAIDLPGGISYVDFLLPGVFVQTVAFGSAGTAIALADDRSKGLIERFRSLPMARSAVLAGRTTADLCRNVVVILLMVTVGYLVGFRVHTNAVAFVGGLLLVLLFAYALSWGAASIGMVATNGETAQLMTFPVLFPFTFASSAFVPVESMPGWLQAFANNQPITKMVDATRALMMGGPTAAPVLHAVLWAVGLLVVLAPLAVRRYRRVV